MVYREINGGWDWVVDLAVDKLEALKLDDFEIVQVKEKFGGLRIYTSHDDQEQVVSIVGHYEHLASKTCEMCGFDGKLCKKGGRLKTLCEPCRAELGYMPDVFWKTTSP